jgi:hypothetical protein
VEVLGACTWYSEEEQVVRAVQTQLVVGVAAVLSYWALVHTVRAVQILLEELVGAFDWYCA